MKVVQNERLLLHKKLETERKHRKEHAALYEQKIRGLCSTHEAARRALEQELASTQQRLSDQREYLTDFVVSDTLYRQVKAAPEAHRSIKEHVQIHVYETMQPLRCAHAARSVTLTSHNRIQLEAARLELQDVRAALEQLTESTELQVSEAARARRLAEAREEGLRLELMAAQDQVKEFGRRLEEECKRV
jgi:hypothetical protein